MSTSTKLATIRIPRSEANVQDECASFEHLMARMADVDREIQAIKRIIQDVRNDLCSKGLSQYVRGIFPLKRGQVVLSVDEDWAAPVQAVYGVAGFKPFGDDDPIFGFCDKKAENEGKDRLDDGALWKNEAILKAAKNIFKQIPRHIRAPRRQPAVQKATGSTSKITTPQVVLDLLERRERLFAQEQGVGHGESRNCVLAEYYMLGIRIEREQYLNTIRLRLIFVVFYRVKQAIEPRGLCYEASYFLARIINRSSIINDALKDIEKNVRSWINYGQRYELLAEDLGGLGTLFILPKDIAESVWQKELPKEKTHEDRVALIDSLKQRGISQEAAERRLHDFADGEVSKIWCPIKQCVEDELQHAFSHATLPMDCRRSATSTGDFPQAATSTEAPANESSDCSRSDPESIRNMNAAGLDDSIPSYTNMQTYLNDQHGTYNPQPGTAHNSNSSAVDLFNAKADECRPQFSGAPRAQDQVSIAAPETSRSSQSLVMATNPSNNTSAQDSQLQNFPTQRELPSVPGTAEQIARRNNSDSANEERTPTSSSWHGYLMPSTDPIGQGANYDLSISPSTHSQQANKRRRLMSAPQQGSQLVYIPSTAHASPEPLESANETGRQSVLRHEAGIGTTQQPNHWRSRSMSHWNSSTGSASTAVPHGYGRPEPHTLMPQNRENRASVEPHQVTFSIRRDDQSSIPGAEQAPDASVDAQIYAYSQTEATHSCNNSSVNGSFAMWQLSPSTNPLYPQVAIDDFNNMGVAGGFATPNESIAAQGFRDVSYQPVTGDINNIGVAAGFATPNESIAAQGFMDVSYQFTGGDFTWMFDTLIKPIEIMIKDPALLFTNVYTSLIYGIYYSFFEVFPLVYPPLYGFNLGETGTTFVHVIVACGFGMVIYVSYLHFYLMPDIIKNGLRAQETRLVPALFAVFGPPVGLFIFGWTACPSIHWIVSVIGIVIYGISVFIILQCIFVYILLSYLQYTALLFAGNDFCCSTFVFGSIFFSRLIYLEKGWN
ncbi:hypothetical protein VTN00DRAFT_2728 [Thermoascus crustaceus]|uniref:uncharacterized protein n=1 Tax=Thermoascus crustaceus TaxID=5088 RepID=UPI0037428BA1